MIKKPLTEIMRVLVAVFILCLLGVCESRERDGDKKRIVNGRVVSISDYPYQVSIEVYGKHFCGGAIISPKLIITAAHCVQVLSIFYPFSGFKVRAGADIAEQQGTIYYAQESIYHPDFHLDPVSSDVALILLRTPIYTSPRSKPIEILKRMPNTGEEAFVTGYGETKKSRTGIKRKLRAISIPIVSSPRCKSLLQAYGEKLTRGMICAGLEEGKDACQGDSGGPLVVDGKLAGITSWGIGCGREDLPGVYANVYSYLPWIVETANKLLRISNRPDKI